MANSSSGRSFLTHQLDYLSLSCLVGFFSQTFSQTDRTLDSQSVDFFLCCCWAPWNCLMTRRMMNHPTVPPSRLFLRTQRKLQILFLRQLLLLLFGCAISVVDHLVALHKGRGPFMKTFLGALVSIECLPVSPVC